ncbi:MAG: NAD(P)H-dependent oxidoreductase subunit E [Actinomycetota bacterium]|nr:NAD(P)H-dependent oxidoreductase subunit E [Actinomycetota bacterium]
MRRETAQPQLLVGELRETAERIIAKYPNSHSATLPLLFLVQSVEGYVTEQGMREVADLLGLTSAQVLSSASFYTMLKKRPQGDYLISVCRNISCTHRGSRDVVKAFEERLGVGVGETTADGRFTLETAECLATCDGAPALQVNYEDFYDVEPADASEIVDRLASGGPLTSTRGERVKTAKEISLETATAGLRSPGTAGDHTARTIGGESVRPDTSPGTRPPELGGHSDGRGGTGA